MSGEPDRPVERMRVPLPVSVDVALTPAILAELLQQSKLYTAKFKPRQDVGRFVEQQVSKDFWLVFYDKLNKGELDFEGFLELLKSYHAGKEITGR